MAIDLTLSPRYDSRGLPEGYDPHKLYEYRHALNSKDAKGLEIYLYKLMPPSLVKSIAFAIDPTARFKVSPGVISPVSRTRYRNTATIFQNRNRREHVMTKHRSQVPNWQGITNCGSPFFVSSDIDWGTADKPLTRQEPLPSVIKDTTKRTRLLGSSQGELEYFKSEVFSTGRTVHGLDESYRYATGFPVDDTCRLAGGQPDSLVYGADVRDFTFSPSSATLSPITYNTRMAQEIAFNKALAAKNVVPLLLAVDPQKRDYSLLRNAIELRDIPRSVLSLKETMEKLRKVFDTFGRSSSMRDLIFDLKKTSPSIPSEYLSFHFGWRQAYRDLEDLLALPSKVAKKLNFLIARSGKPTTFRAKRNHLSAETGVSGFDYDSVAGFEQNIQTESTLTRESEIRIVVNSTFDFPPTNEPLLNRHRFYDRIGLNPRIIDVYNLTPWTWLFDWFTGCGQYVELIESINRDSSLINWGMITVHTKGKLTTQYRSIQPVRSRSYLDNVLLTDSAPNAQINHESYLEFECQTRQDVAAVFDVKQTSVPSSLSAYQFSILGALLAQRMGSSSPGSFISRS